MSAVYDLAGNCIFSIDANGNQSTYEYTTTGKLQSSTLPGGYYSRNWHDPSGYILCTTDNEGLEKPTSNVYRLATAEC